MKQLLSTLPWLSCCLQRNWDMESSLPALFPGVTLLLVGFSYFNLWLGHHFIPTIFTHLMPVTPVQGLSQDISLCRRSSVVLSRLIPFLFPLTTKLLWKSAYFLLLGNWVYVISESEQMGQQLNKLLTLQTYSFFFFVFVLICLFL